MKFRVVFIVANFSFLRNIDFLILCHYIIMIKLQVVKQEITGVAYGNSKRFQ